jgi:hypothetical protein
MSLTSSTATGAAGKVYQVCSQPIQAIVEGIFRQDFDRHFWQACVVKDDHLQ